MDIVIANYYPLFLPYLGGVEHNIYYFAKYSKYKHIVITDLLPNTKLREQIYMDANKTIQVYRVPPSRILCRGKFCTGLDYVLDVPRDFLKFVYTLSLQYDVFHLRAPWIHPRIFNIIDNMLSKSFFKLCTAWRFNKKPMVTTFHALPELDFPLHDNLSVPNPIPRRAIIRGTKSFLNYYSYITQKSKVIIVVDLHMFIYLKSLAKSKPILHIPSGIDTNIFKPLEKKYALKALLDNLSLNEETAHKLENIVNSLPTVLYVGRFGYEKGTHIVLKLVPKLAKKYGFLIAGHGGVFEKYFEALDTRMKNVVYLGKVPNNLLQYLYNVAYIVINPVLWHGISRITLEAMACGKPTIMVNGSRIRYTLINRFNGYVAKNILEIPIFIDEILKREEMYQYISRNALETAQKFSVNKLAEIVDAVYESAYEENYRILKNVLLEYPYIIYEMRI